MTRVLVTGGSGLLGRHLIRCAPSGVELHATRHRAPVQGATAHPVDLSDAGAVARLFERLRPEVVVHTAYATADGERHIVRSTEHVVAGCARAGAHLVHLSSDALLDGEDAPYDEEARPAPVHEYGRFKAAAEARVREALPGATVVRTSLITEFEPLDPRSEWIARSLREGTPLTLFTDEIRSPIAPDDLAAQIWEILGLPAAERGGAWNLAGPEALSRYALGLLVAAHERLDAAGITPALAATSPTPRPRDLRLRTDRADRALRTRPRPVSTLVAPRP